MDLKTKEVNQNIGRIASDLGSGNAIIVEISNFHTIISVYGYEFAVGIMNDLRDKITKELVPVTPIEILDDGVFLLFCKHHDEALHRCIDQLHSLIKFHLSPSVDKPIHLSEFMGVIDLNYLKSVNPLEICYIALKQRAEEDGSYFSMYSDAIKLNEFYSKQMQMSEEFKRHILAKKLQFAFQPIVNSSDGTNDYYECLLRIVKSDSEFVSVGPYIPVAENLGFIDIIDETVLEMVVGLLKEYPHISLSFNISALAIDNSILLEKIMHLFSDRAVAERAIIEITETALQRDLQKAAIFVSTLQNLGCRVALDDFGAGNSSFKQLVTLPIDVIKIDGAYVRNIMDNKDSLLFVKMILTVCKSFGIKTVAEFVENGEIAKRLMELGVDSMQGNYFSPALNYKPWLPK